MDPGDGVTRRNGFTLIEPMVTVAIIMRIGCG
jgi:hypothetical protein